MTKQDSSENQAKLVYLAIGSNLGNKKHNIDKAKLELKTYNIKLYPEYRIHENSTVLLLEK